VIGQVDVRSAAVNKCGSGLRARIREVLRIEYQSACASQDKRRPLQNVIERSIILTNGPELRVAMPEFNRKPAAAAHVRVRTFRK
jgi:hypothetical protein